MQLSASLARHSSRFVGQLQAACEQLAAELAEQFPDPVNVFEDDLARKLGLRQHPAMPLDQWRRLRVRFINALDDEGLSDEPVI